MNDNAWYTKLLGMAVVSRRTLLRESSNSCLPSKVESLVSTRKSKDKHMQSESRECETDRFGVVIFGLIRNPHSV